MQELFIPELAASLDKPFDDYTVLDWSRARQDAGVVLFHKTDDNGKNHYMVADRVEVEGVDAFYITNVKEFKHARDRAHRYYAKRIEEMKHER